MRRFIGPLVCLVVSITCGIIYSFSDVYVDKDGTLVEPFFLIPIGWFFGLLSLLWVGVLLLFSIAKWMTQKYQQKQSNAKSGE